MRLAQSDVRCAPHRRTHRCKARLVAQLFAAKGRILSLSGRRTGSSRGASSAWTLSHQATWGEVFAEIRHAPHLPSALPPGLYRDSLTSLRSARSILGSQARAGQRARQLALGEELHGALVRLLLAAAAERQERHQHANTQSHLGAHASEIPAAEEQCIHTAVKAIHRQRSGETITQGESNTGILWNT